jgi:hypothetical protein
MPQSVSNRRQGEGRSEKWDYGLMAAFPPPGYQIYDGSQRRIVLSEGLVPAPAGTCRMVWYPVDRVHGRLRSYSQKSSASPNEGRSVPE